MKEFPSGWEKVLAGFFVLLLIALSFASVPLPRGVFGGISLLFLVPLGAMAIAMVDRKQMLRHLLGRPSQTGDEGKPSRQVIFYFLCTIFFLALAYHWLDVAEWMAFFGLLMMILGGDFV